MVLSLFPHKSTYTILLRIIYSRFNIIGSYGVVLFCFYKGFRFPLKVSLVWQCPILFMSVFTSLLLKISIQLFFFQLLLPGYCCSICTYVANAAIGSCNKSFFVLFNVFLEFLFWFIYAIFNVGEFISAFFSWLYYYYYCCFRKCPWCNGYRRRKWTRWHEFKSWTRLIAFHIALKPLGKVWIQLFSLQL